MYLEQFCKPRLGIAVQVKGLYGKCSFIVAVPLGYQDGLLPEAVDGRGWQGAPEAGRAYFFGNACWEISRYFRPAIYVRTTIMKHQL